MAAYPEEPPVSIPHYSQEAAVAAQEGLTLIASALFSSGTGKLPLNYAPRWLCGLSG
jgi:hypothetical protein